MVNRCRDEPVSEGVLSDTELEQLRIRVVALENIVIALLATASDRQVDLVRKMAAHISPRPGFTQHRLTVHAAVEVLSLVERAEPFRARRAKRPRCPIPCEGTWMNQIPGAVRPAHSHSHSHDPDLRAAPEAKTGLKDPVCGMTVTPDSKHTLQHAGRPVYFCSAGYKAKFAADADLQSARQ